MSELTRRLLERHGIRVECESPLEISLYSDTEGSRASGVLAEIVIDRIAMAEMGGGITDRTDISE